MLYGSRLPHKIKWNDVNFPEAYWKSLRCTWAWRPLPFENCLIATEKENGCWHVYHKRSKTLIVIIFELCILLRFQRIVDKWKIEWRRRINTVNMVSSRISLILIKIIIYIFFQHQILSWLKRWSQRNFHKFLNNPSNIIVIHRYKQEK